jgi:hypothetical protein
MTGEAAAASGMIDHVGIGVPDLVEAKTYVDEFTPRA